MNRYPAWVYALIAAAIAIAFLYTVPNFFGEAPAVQVSSAKSTVKVDPALMAKVEATLQKANLPYTGALFDANSMRVRFADIDTQLKARDTIDRALNADPANADYSVALNLLSASPRWLTAIHALPMYLGLDLRGGVHFLLQVDLQAALTKRAENIAVDPSCRTTSRSTSSGSGSNNDVSGGRSPSGYLITNPSSDHITSTSTPATSRMRAVAAIAQGACTRLPSGDNTATRQSPRSSRERSITSAA